MVEKEMNPGAAATATGINADEKRRALVCPNHNYFGEDRYRELQVKRVMAQVAVSPAYAAEIARLAYSAGGEL